MATPRPRFRGVTTRSKQADTVVAAAETYAGEVSTGFNAVLLPVLPDEAPPLDLEPLQVALATLVKHYQAEMERSNQSHVVEMFDVAAPRNDRDKALAALYAKFVEVRRAATGAYGTDEADRLLAIAGETPRESKALLQQTAISLERLAGEDLEVPEEAAAGLQVDVAAWRLEIEPLYQRLKDLLPEVGTEVREELLTLVDKTRAVNRFDRVLGPAARLLEGLYELSGFPELADRVRPATRRRRTSAGEETEPEAAGSAQAGETPEAPAEPPAPVADSPVA